MKSINLILAAVAAMAALALASCSEADGSGATDTVSTSAQGASLEWSRGDENSLVYSDAEREVIRCWRVQQRFDCLYANEADIRSKIADAPVRRTIFRFLVPRLPQNGEEIARLQQSDGYVCDITEGQGQTIQSESIWQSGREILTNSARAGLGEPGWTSEQVFTALRDNALRAERPYFGCIQINDVISDTGITAIDSPVVTYERFTATSGPAEPAREVAATP